MVRFSLKQTGPILALKRQYDNYKLAYSHFNHLIFLLIR